MIKSLWADTTPNVGISTDVMQVLSFYVITNHLQEKTILSMDHIGHVSIQKMPISILIQLRRNRYFVILRIMQDRPEPKSRRRTTQTTVSMNRKINRQLPIPVDPMETRVKRARPIEAL